ncbi:serine/arginine repetitive matrix protein 1 isoform X3 [Manihot esculenta]|uniref:serine/arginine repetitive matrix protein 1 isoform X3 n=1 Tax=Manihot esculenta TaxID=3983 RepID=UPI001CC44166|nr:serine/arginine repetitive matrix protein 1 isoform X3 [Manihot esculenta]
MSGGFFRGTSADQDTRFSNKQAKLLKSQKFAPELEHLVDMRKVKMDVIRPWIANRVTELLGFEDEVLINFIYGLLDAKEVNGKEVQISLTGFMEKNTGKFMKELWTLLLSAQKTDSGVPQQFLDAKEEETRKKQAEVDRITNEIQKKKEKEGRELEWERSKKMDGGPETKAIVAAVEQVSKHMAKGSSADAEDVKETDNRNGVRGRNGSSRSPHSVDRSSSSPRGSPSRNSSDRHKTRSLSRSPETQRRSVSSDRVYHSPGKRSITPRRRFSSRGSLSPSRRRYSRPRSRSSSRHMSPSPVRRRLHSPFRRRSPSPIRRRSPSLSRRRSPSPIRRRRSPSPIRRRRSPSPIQRRRSPSPIRRRRSPSPLRRRRSPLPLRRRSPSPVWRRSPSPMQRRSPSLIRRRSPPSRRKSPSPFRRRYQRSPSTPHRRSPSPRRRSPLPSRRRSPLPSRQRSPSPYGSSSPSPVRYKSPSPVRKSSKEHRRSLVQSPGERVGVREKPSPVLRRSFNSLRSPQTDPKDGKDSRVKLASLSPSPERSPVRLESPPLSRTRNSSEDRRLTSPYESPVRQRKGTRNRSSSPYESPVRQRKGIKNRSSSPSASPARQRRGHITHDDSLSPPRMPRQQKTHQESPRCRNEDENTDHARDFKSRSSQKQSTHSSIISKQKESPVKVHSKEHSPQRVAGHRVTESRSRLDIVESRKKEQEINSEKGSQKGAYAEIPEQQKSPTSFEEPLLGERQLPYAGEGRKSDERNHSHSNKVKDSEKNRAHSNKVKDSDRHHKSETMPMLVEKADHSNGGGGAFDSGSEESNKRTTDDKEKRRHKRSHREEVASDDDYSYDSEYEERKEAKRRRKEEKKLRKEEKRRRREERRRRREERRAEKLKLKDLKDNNSSDDEFGGRMDPSDSEDAHSEQKKLEIELRKKALESLKAKKGISH